MQSDTPIKLRVPRQDLASFSPFEANTDAAREWAQHLPVTNTRSVVMQLLEAIGDLNHFGLAPEVRYQVLETLRPNINIALSNLSRRFLNQPLVMPVEPRQMAELADNLLGELITAYTVVAIEGLQKRDSIRDMNPARLVCEAIQRALAYAGRKLLQSFQLYRPVELNGWLTIHQLYALAERQGLARLPVEDSIDGDSSISSSYLQAVMLGCCKPNQLRQSDLTAIFRALRDWSSLINLQGPDAGNGLFLVSLETDQPPLYSSLYGSRVSAQCRKIDTAPLIKNLQQLQAEDDKRGKPGIPLEGDITLPSNMLNHLIESLGSMSMRNFHRADSGTVLRVSVGLSSAHFHAAGEKAFEQLLYGDQYIPPPADRVATNPFMKKQSPTRDMWGEANPDEDFVREENLTDGEAEVAHRVDVDESTMMALENEDIGLPPGERHPVHEAMMANASPGGYCLEWSTGFPDAVMAGEIVSVQEEVGGNWAIAVIRWVSQLKNSRTLVGLELLSPKAMPYGAQIRQKTGDESAPIRVLLLPEIKLVGQPHTLVTPRAGFRERQKLTLLRAGEKFHVQLQRQVNATASFAQFDFRYIRELGDLLAEDKSGPLDSSYDSLWSNI